MRGIVARYIRGQCLRCTRARLARGLCRGCYQRRRLRRELPNLRPYVKRALRGPSIDGRIEVALAAAEESGRVPAGLRAWIMRPDPLGLLAVAERRAA